jgi:hypothetical protein
MLGQKSFESLNSWDFIESANYTCRECELQYGPADRMLALQVIHGKPVVMCFLCIDAYDAQGNDRGLPHGWRYMSRATLARMTS